MVNPNTGSYTKILNNRKILLKCKKTTYWKQKEY